jgi:hypothetical protein
MTAFRRGVVFAVYVNLDEMHEAVFLSGHSLFIRFCLVRHEYHLREFVHSE